MPVLFTFDLSDAPSVDRNRIQSFFERLGWQNLGGSAYRYPRLGAQITHPTEDWFNHVIPALMLFRSYVLTSGNDLPKFTIDVQSSSGWNSSPRYANPPLGGEQIQFYPTSQNQFGAFNLRRWIDSVTFPYPTSQVSSGGESTEQD